MPTILLPKPHSPGQKSLITSRENDVVFAGRRYGKTHLGVQRIIQSSLEKPGLYWWVGLGWKSASLKRAWRELKAFTQTIWQAYGGKPEHHIHESAKEIDWPWGAEVWMRTAEKPDSMAGEGIHGAVFDEFTLAEERVWTEYLEGTLLDYNGWLLAIGVPKGQNWGARLWKSCAVGPDDYANWRGSRKGWRAWHFPTHANPFMSKEKLEDIRLNTPSGLYQQEYLAQIIEKAGVVFKNIDNCLGSMPLDRPVPGHNYVFGLDWGKSNDFTVITIIDIDERRLVGLIRFNEDDYPTQLENVREWFNLFRPRNIVAESNAMGEPLCDQLIADGLPISKFYSTNSSKRDIIEALQVAFEQVYITIFDDPFLIRELEEYESDVTALGNIRYNAPEGGHDDCVMSLALAYNEIRFDIGISL